jgi:hypothetical protein
MASKIFYRNSFEYILTIPEEKCNRLIKDDCFYNAIKKYKEIHYLQLNKNFIHTSNNNLNNINNIIMYKHKPEYNFSRYSRKRVAHDTLYTSLKKQKR